MPYWRFPFFCPDDMFIVNIKDNVKVYKLLLISKI